MYGLSQKVEFKQDGKRREGVICGRTREAEPRYNIMVGDEIVKDVTADKIVTEKPHGVGVGV